MTKNYFPEIDGLRALAVTLVFAFHLHPILAPGGFIGVDIFFVISGFLISRIIITQLNEGRFSFIEFYSRRVQRIFPALFALLFLTTIMALLSLGASDLEDFMRAMRFAAAQASNFLFAQQVDYFATGHQHSALLHTWSLGVEEQFYLVWPLLIYLAHRFLNSKVLGLVLSIIILISFSLNIIWVQSDPMQAFYMLHTRAWQLGVGGLIAAGIFPSRINKNLHHLIAVTGLLMVIVASYTINSETIYPGYSAILPTLGAGLLVYAAQLTQKTWGLSLFNLSPTIFVGKISYSLYLWHWPFIAFIKIYTQEELTLFLGFAIVFVSLIFAFLSWKYIETPFRTHNRSLGIPFSQLLKPIYFGLGLILLFILSANLLKNLSEHKLRLKPIYEISGLKNIGEFIEYKVPAGCRFKYNEKNQKATLPDDHCVYGSNKKTFEVLLFGDSHAAHYTLAVLDWAKRKNLSVMLVTSSACPALLGDHKLIFQDKYYDRCHQFSQKIEDMLHQRTHIQYVMLGMRSSIYLNSNKNEESRARVFLTSDHMPDWTIETSRKVFQKNLDYTLKKLASLGKKTIILGEVPMLRISPKRCLENQGTFLGRAFPLSIDRCYQFDFDYINNRLKFGESVFKKAVEKYKVTFFDPRPFIKKARINEKMIYFDDDHLNPSGSEFLGQYLNF